jgi:hypothetical protein
VERDELAEQLVGTWRRHDEILLALKQTGLRLPERVARQGWSGTWIFGKQARLVLERVQLILYQFNGDDLVVIGPHLSQLRVINLYDDRDCFDTG